MTKVKDVLINASALAALIGYFVLCGIAADRLLVAPVLVPRWQADGQTTYEYGPYAFATIIIVAGVAVATTLLLVYACAVLLEKVKRKRRSRH